MSRNPRISSKKNRSERISPTGSAALLIPIFFAQLHAQPLLPAIDATPSAKVVVVQDSAATTAFRPHLPTVRKMIRTGLLALTGKSSVSNAWESLISPHDVVGIKVFSAPGENSGTRPAVVAAVIESMIDSGHPSTNIVIWDRRMVDLRHANFHKLAKQYNVRLRGSHDAGYDPMTFYESPVLGRLIYGDSEFGKNDEITGRKSFVSNLLTSDITRIINIPPLLNHNYANVTGTLYSLAMGSVDNTIRFQNSPPQLAVAVPELYALEQLSDRVAFSLVDALTCQYQGQETSLLHYSVPLNQLRFSSDPVALDVVSIAELNHQRESAQAPKGSSNQELFENASLLQLGISDPDQIEIERISNGASD